MSSAIHHMLDVIPFRELFYLCKASYKPLKAAKKCLENHNISWVAIEQTDMQYKLYGSWKITILKHKTLDEWAFTVEGTSSMRNLIADFVNQVTKKTCIIQDVQKFIEHAQEKHHMQLNYGMGHSAGGFIAEQAVKTRTLKQICVMTLNSQRPQVDGNFINFRSSNDPISARPLAAYGRSYTIPEAKGHDINGFKEVKHLSWENIVPGYSKTPIPHSTVTSSNVVTINPPNKEMALIDSQKNQSSSGILPNIIGSITGLVVGTTVVERGLRWYNANNKDNSDKWVHTASITGGCAAIVFNLYFNKSPRFSLISTLASTIVSGVTTKSAIELHRRLTK